MRDETLAIHAGYETDPTTRAVAAPIYQTVAYEFDDAQHGADLFNLAVPGDSGPRARRRRARRFGDHGVNAVVHSLTKYMGGHGTRLVSGLNRPLFIARHPR